MLFHNYILTFLFFLSATFYVFDFLFGRSATDDLQYNLTRRVEAVSKIEFEKSSKSVAKNYTGELIRLSEKSKERRGSEKNTSPLDLSQIQLSNNNNNNSNSKCETENSTVLTDKDTNSDSTSTSANIPNFYDKKRIPSYTDRVLYKSLPGFIDNMKLSEFYSCENVPSSDHKPVVCSFELKTTDGGVNIQKSKKETGLSVEIYDLRGFNLAEMDSVLGAAGTYVLT
jgi:hypothetical protein